jgi:hypothetical protein
LEHPDVVIAQLKKAGVEARIVEVPIGDGSNDRPGVWVDVGYDNPDPAPRGAWFNTWWGRRHLSLPKDVHGTATLFVGRKARTGETPAPPFLDNELGPTGDFWCLALERMHPADATARVEGLGFEVLWEWRQLPISEEGAGDAWRIDELPQDAALVRAALPNDPGVVVFQLVDERFAEEERQSWGAPSDRGPRRSAGAPPGRQRATCSVGARPRPRW